MTTRFTQTPAQVAQQTAISNKALILANIASALVRLRQIQTQAAAFQSQVPYVASNLTQAMTALNDLLAKSQLIAAAVNDEAGYLIQLARLLTDQLDGTN